MIFCILKLTENIFGASKIAETFQNSAKIDPVGHFLCHFSVRAEKNLLEVHLIAHPFVCLLELVLVTLHS